MLELNWILMGLLDNIYIWNVMDFIGIVCIYIDIYFDKLLIILVDVSIEERYWI